MTEKQYEFNIGSLVVVVIIIGVILISLLSSIYTIQPGERGVLLTWGKADPVPRQAGLHFKVPYVQEIIKMDIRTQKYEALKASAASMDLQTVTTDVTVNYYINPDSVVEIYSKLGLNYQDKIISPAIQEIVKASTARYTAEQLITKRPEIKELIDTKLRERLAEWNIVVQSIAITNFDFSQSFNAAIEAKVTAEQNALAAKNKLAQVEYEAQQRITQAQGEAEAIRIQAEAINKQGGQDYVQLQAISKWNGILPTYTGGGAVPFINIPMSSNVQVAQ